MERAATGFEAAGKSEHARLKREQAASENQRQFRFNFAHQQPCGQEAALPAPTTAAPTTAAATATAAPLPAAPLPAADTTDAFSEWFSSSTDAEALVAFFEPASTVAATDAASVTTAAAEPSVSVATASQPSSTLPPQPPKPPEDDPAGTSTALCDATVGIDAQFDSDLEAIQAAAEAPSAARAAGAGSKHSTQPTAAEGNPAAVPVAEGVAPSGAPATHYQLCKHVFARNFIDMPRLGEHAESEMFSYSNEPIELFQCKSCPIGCGCKPTQQCPNRTCSLDCSELHRHRGFFKPILPFCCSVVAQKYREQCRECEWLETSADKRDLWRKHRLDGSARKSSLHQQAVAAEAKWLDGSLGAPPEPRKRHGLYTRTGAMSALKSKTSAACTAEQRAAAQIAQVCLKKLSPVRLSFL